MNIDDKKLAISVIEERFGCKLEELKEITDIIYKNYRNKFSSQQLYGESKFHIIAQNTSKKNKNAYWTLSEKCIRRSYDLCEIGKQLKSSNKILREFEQAKALTNIIERLIPSEIFWAMEEQNEDGYSFNEHEQKCYDYLEEVATFYLDETKIFEKNLENATFSKRKKLSK